MVNLTKDEKACVLMQVVDKLSIKKRREILSLFDNYGDIFECYDDYQEQLEKIGSHDFYTHLKDAIESGAVEKQLERCERENVVPVTYVSENYPDKLANIACPPLVLFCKGRVELLDSDLAIGVVGSRKVSRYGMDVAEKFGKDLATNGITVVSGMARGIDSASQKGSLSVGGDTIAVVATGLDIVYPPENRALFDELTESGLVVTEYVLGTPPMTFRFPERNRIINGLSDGLLVVEAGEKSGALITLECAIEEGRECFIVPANIDSRTAKGSNAMLRTMPHAITFDVEDILSRFGRRAKKVQEASAIQLDFTEMKIVELLETGEKHFDEILSQVEISANDLSSLLTRMEISGIIKNTGGNFYSL